MRLESQMARYADLKGIPAIDCGEGLIEIRTLSGLIANPIDPNLPGFNNEKVFARQSVVKKLKNVVKALKTNDPQLDLEIVYGYRPLLIQIALFKKFKKSLQQRFCDLALLEEIHRKIAIPEVSGHPTGGAVDVQIVKGVKPLKFGTKIWEFGKDSYTFSPFINTEAKRNRKILRDLMLEQGFAPFDGEWWHFSYGDKEWAYYYNQPNAIYDQLKSFREL